MNTLLQASWKMRQCRQQRNLLVSSSVWSVWIRHFRSYVGKMAAVQCGKCTLFHTHRFDRYEGSIRVLSVHLFSPQS